MPSFKEREEKRNHIPKKVSPHAARMLIKKNNYSLVLNKKNKGEKPLVID